LDRLDRTNDHTRMSFAYALGSLGHPKGTATMIEFLPFPDWGDQVRALEALGEFGDERALGPVSKALRDPHANVRVAAAQALGEIGGAAEISALEAIYTDNTQRPCFSPITVGEAASQAVVRIRSRLALPV
jgi:HEAT repeat protein